MVSTHSRPKAAVQSLINDGASYWFQHTAARRRLINQAGKYVVTIVSTHSRPKAADRT